MVLVGRSVDKLLRAEKPLSASPAPGEVISFRVASSSQKGVSQEWRQDKEDLGRFIAPEGLQDSAQGFNPISANLL